MKNYIFNKLALVAVLSVVFCQAAPPKSKTAVQKTAATKSSKPAAGAKKTTPTPKSPTQARKKQNVTRGTAQDNPFPEITARLESAAQVKKELEEGLGKGTRQTLQSGEEVEVGTQPQSLSKDRPLAKPREQVPGKGFAVQTK